MDSLTAAGMPPGTGPGAKLGRGEGEDNGREGMGGEGDFKFQIADCKFQISAFAGTSFILEWGDHVGSPVRAIDYWFLGCVAVAATAKRGGWRLLSGRVRVRFRVCSKLHTLRKSAGIGCSVFGRLAFYTVR